MRNSKLLRVSRLSLALTAALGASSAFATQIVTSCLDDNSAGTLRYAIANSVSDEEIDVHTSLPLTCSSITLSLGQIQVAHNIQITGPTDRELDIVGSGQDRLFDSTSIDAPSAYIEFDNLNLKGGRITATSSAAGGCIQSVGGVRLSNTNVSDCQVQSMGNAQGGAISAASVMLNYSAVTDSRVYAASTAQFARGAGVSVSGNLDCTASTVSGNKANGYFAQGAGIFTSGTVTLERCAVDSNQALKSAGGVYAQGGGIFEASSTASVAIRDSTISSNSDQDLVGGVYSKSLLNLYNSTVAFNSSGVLSSGDIITTSSIFSNNSGVDLTLAGRATLSGSQNLVMNTTATAPMGTITVTADPQLTPLAFHGGPTRTHGLSASSPAIDQGSNQLDESTDQRGAGFPREVPAGATDIGAFERKADDDQLFYNGFD